MPLPGQENTGKNQKVKTIEWEKGAEHLAQDKTPLHGTGRGTGLSQLSRTRRGLQGASERPDTPPGGHGLGTMPWLLRGPGSLPGRREHASRRSFTTR